MLHEQSKNVPQENSLLAPLVLMRYVGPERDIPWKVRFQIFDPGSKPCEGLLLLRFALERTRELGKALFEWLKVLDSLDFDLAGTPDDHRGGLAHSVTGDIFGKRGDYCATDAPCHDRHTLPPLERVIFAAICRSD